MRFVFATYSIIARLTARVKAYFYGKKIYIRSERDAQPVRDDAGCSHCE